MVYEKINEEHPFYKEALAIHQGVKTAHVKKEVLNITQSVAKDVECEIKGKIREMLQFNQIGVAINKDERNMSIIFPDWFINWLDSHDWVKCEITLDNTHK